MDGVLADFFTTAIERLNAHTGENITVPDYAEAKSGWDLHKAYGMGSNRMWAILDAPGDFWQSLKPFPWAHFLVSFANCFGDVYIATSPRPDPLCYYQKTKWLQDHLGIDLSKVIPTNHKHLMSRKDTILIDDSPKNIDRFNEGEGIGILVPSNWNTINLQYTEVCGVILRHVAPPRRGTTSAHEVCSV